MSRVHHYDLSEEQFRKDRTYGIVHDLMYINHAILWMDDKTIKEFERLSR